jgi:hypothetical protein
MGVGELGSSEARTQNLVLVKAEELEVEGGEVGVNEQGDGLVGGGQVG